MREEARAAAEKEPLLVSFVYSTILNQNSLEAAVAFHLANKVGTFVSRIVFLGSTFFCVFGVMSRVARERGILFKLSTVGVKRNYIGVCIKAHGIEEREPGQQCRCVCWNIYICMYVFSTRKKHPWSYRRAGRPKDTQPTLKRDEQIFVGLRGARSII